MHKRHLMLLAAAISLPAAAESCNYQLGFSSRSTVQWEDTSRVFRNMTQAQVDAMKARTRTVAAAAAALQNKGGPYTITLAELAVCDNVVGVSAAVDYPGVTATGMTQILRSISATDSSRFADMDARAKAGKPGPWGKDQ